MRPTVTSSASGATDMATLEELKARIHDTLDRAARDLLVTARQGLIELKQIVEEADMSGIDLTELGKFCQAEMDALEVTMKPQVQPLLDLANTIGEIAAFDAGFRPDE